MKKSKAVFQTPFTKLGITCQNDQLISIDFLSDDVVLQTNSDPYTNFIINEIKKYIADPKHRFSITFDKVGTTFQQKVWRALEKIPSGETITYGELAKRLNTGPRAIGQACRTNPVPLIVPCHRVVAQKSIGGFAGERLGELIKIKNWLLHHEKASNKNKLT